MLVKVVTALVAVLVVSGCASGGVSDEIVDLTTTSGVVSSTVPTSTTSEAPTTTSTTAPAATTTEESGPGSTTVEDLAAEIEADLQAGRDEFTRQMADPVDVDYERLSEWFTEDGLEGSRASQASLLEDSWGTRAGAQNLDVVVVESVNVLDDRTVLTVLCFTNDLVVFDLSSGETVDDSLGSIRASTLVHHIDGRWKSDAPDTLSIVEGPECA
jgi:hypothetical protein